MKMIFMGTPALAAATLGVLHREHEIIAVVTQPDKPAGRGHKLQFSPVKEYSLQRGIPVFQPERARDESFIAEVQKFQPEAIAVVAYGQILPREILELPSENFQNGGCVNLHYSLLPRWRGAAPVQYAVWCGDAVTGVTTQWMAEKLDAGDIILQREIAISPQETSGELFEKLVPLGAQVLLETMRLMQNGAAPRTPQNEELATFAPTIKKEDSRIDWNQNAREIQNRIHAFNPRPGAWCEFRGEPLKIWRARVETKTLNYAAFPKRFAGNILEPQKRVAVIARDHEVELLEVQPSGKPKMPALDWARGARLTVTDKME